LILSNKIYDCNGYGVFGHKGDATIKNNWIYDSDKGIKLSAGASADIYNNTIVNNISYGIEKGGGQGVATISNCIIWDCNDDLSGCSATFSCIEDGDAGTGNISSDPNFVDADANDYHIFSDSPCVDVGDANGDYDGEVDIDGEDRVLDGDRDGNDVVDMGADEVYVPPCWSCESQCHGDGAQCDQFVDEADFDVLYAAWGTDYWNDWNGGDGPYNPCADFDNDGVVGLYDFYEFNEHWGEEGIEPNCPMDGIWPPMP
jgi:hypothetical protein